jgi:acyl dehydratase
MEVHYYEDVEMNYTIVSPGRTVTETDVMMFAGLSGDYNPLHTDEELMKESQFGKRIAHGMLGLSIATGLVSRTFDFEGTAIALLGINNWKFLKPIFIGDTIRVRITVIEKRLSKSNPSQGVINRLYEIINQNEETVQKGELPLMVKTKSSITGN